VRKVEVAGIEIGGGGPLVLIAGPCVIESPERTLRIATGLAQACRAAGVPWIFKASFDKANRTSLDSYRGPGLEVGLEVLQAVRSEVGVPVTTDVHLPSQVEAVAQAVDLLQVPAFLCRQTDLLVACGRTGRPTNLKKGQFVAPEDMAYAVQKCRESGASGVLVTERGTTFGHGDLVVDLRGVKRLHDLDIPVVYDATHSVQRRGSGTTGGDRSMVMGLARAAVAAGVDAVFAEVHDDPSQARSDAATQWPLDAVRPLLETLVRIRSAL